MWDSELINLLKPKAENFEIAKATVANIDPVVLKIDGLRVQNNIFCSNTLKCQISQICIEDNLIVVILGSEIYIIDRVVRLQ
ncbi:MAG: hypothetical protein RR728_02170 [Oscillospiraceae bacterium]